MSKTKKEIEEALVERLKACLESDNQDGAFKSLSYDQETGEAVIVLDVAIVEEDGYIGFEGY